MSGAQGRSYALVVVAICVIVNAGLLALGGYALSRSTYLSVEFVEAEGDCGWGVEIPAGDGAEDPHVVCVRSIGGVSIEPLSVAKDPMYVGGREQFQRWVAHQRALYSALQGQDRVTLELVEDSLSPPTLVAALGGFQASKGLPEMLAALFTASVGFLIGCFVLISRPQRPPARALFVVGMAIVLVILPTLFTTARGIAAPPWCSLVLYQINMLGLTLGGLGAFFLAATFPVHQLGRHTRTLAFTLPVGLAVVVQGLELSGVVGATHWLYVPLILLALVLFVRSQFLSISQLQRLEARWILWGVAVPIMAFTITRVPLLLGIDEGANPTDGFMTVTFVAVPAGVAVAVLRYRLMDIEVVVRRTIMGAVVTLLVLFLYHLVLALFAGSITEQASSAPMLYTVLVTALVLTIVVGPIQARLEAQLDRLFFRNRFHYRRVLARVPDGLAQLNSPDAAAEHVLSSVGEAMELGRMLVALEPADGASRVWDRVRPGTRYVALQATLAPPDDPSVWNYLATLDRPYLCDASSSGHALDRWMEQQGLEFVLPLRTPEALVGLLGCSAPARGGLFSSDDIEALSSVASSLALALSHALAYETIRKMNDELEDRIEQRTAELDKVRLQLYQWEKMASLGVLAAGVAHELNTPLGVVLSAVEQLSEQLNPREQGDEMSARLLELSIEAARRASLIIRDLRSFSRPESSAVQSLDIHECIDSTLRLLGPSLRAQKIDVITDYGQIKSVEGFPALFNQTLTNLVLNAAAAIKSEGSIHISTMPRGDDHVRVVVQDSGPGIPEDLRSRIFEPFYTTKAPGEGTGLGLSLCYTFVSQHGGRIWEDGEPGQGARFVVELPVRMSEEQRSAAQTPYELQPGPRQP
jgi:signal transduction histidine kinase